MLNLPEMILIDNHIAISLLHQEDAEQLFSLAENNRDYLSKHVSWIKKINSLKDESYFIERCIDGFSKSSCAHYAIKIRDHEIIGSIGFIKIDKELNEAHIGYWLSPSHQGCGIMSRIINRLINITTRDTPLRTFIIVTSSENMNSQKLALQNQFFLSNDICDPESEMITYKRIATHRLP